MSGGHATTASHALRPAEISDARLLFDWVNNPESLAQKELTGGPIPWDEHQSWLAQRLVDDNTLLFIVEDKETPSGQVRLQRRAGAFEIDIYIAPSARRRGLARTAITASLDALEGSRPGARVRARVKSDNAASIRLFESLGFEKAPREDKYGENEHGKGEYSVYMRGPTARSEQP